MQILLISDNRTSVKFQPCTFTAANDGTVAPGMRKNKPMRPEDFEKIEGTLQKEMFLRSQDFNSQERNREGVLSDDDIEPLSQSCGMSVGLY